MRLGVLFSGGKDSAYALMKAMEYEEVVCLISLISENKESYMFHTPNIGLARKQASAINLPIVEVSTKGEQKKELEDLKKAIECEIKQYQIEGVVTGAIESVYQAERVQRICESLGLWCFNPLWKKDQIALLQELVENNFEVIISGIFAYPLTEVYLGRKLDKPLIEELVALKGKYLISPSGEGGEIETTVLDAPFFAQKIIVEESEHRGEGHSAELVVKKAVLVNK